MNIKPGDRIKLTLEVFSIADHCGAIVVRWPNGPCLSIRKEHVEEVIPAPRPPFHVGDHVRTRVDKAVLEILSVSYIQDQEWAWCWWAEGGSPISVRTDELRSEPKP